MNQQEEEKLVKKAIKGNRKAYGKLVEAYQIYLYKTAFLYVKNEQDALDAVQNCVMKGMVAIEKLREPAFFKTWLTKILINNIYREKEKSVPIISLEEYQEKATESTCSMEERIDLYQAVDLLRPVYKTVIILYFFSGMKIKEIAEIMDIPEGTVKGYMARAKKELKQSLQEEAYHDQRKSI